MYKRYQTWGKRRLALVVSFSMLLPVWLQNFSSRAAEYQQVTVYTAGEAEKSQNADGFNFTSGDGGRAIISQSVLLDGFSVDFKLHNFTHTHDIVDWSKNMILAIAVSDTTDSVLESTKDTKAFVFRVEPIVKDGGTGIRIEGFAKTGASSYDSARIDGAAPPIIMFDYNAETVMNLSIKNDGGGLALYFNGKKQSGFDLSNAAVTGAFTGGRGYAQFASHVSGAAGAQLSYTVMNVNGIFMGNKDVPGHNRTVSEGDEKADDSVNLLGAPSDYTVKDFGGDPPGVSSIVSGDRGLTFKKSGTSNSSMLAMKKDAAAMTGFEMAFQMDRFVSYRSSWSAPMSYYQVAFVDSAAEDGAGQNGVAFQFTPYEGTVLSAAGNRLRIEAFKVTNGAVDAGSRLDGSNPAHVAMEIENPYAAGSVNNPQIKFAIKQEGDSLVVYINDTAYSQYDLSSAGALASSCYLRMDLNCAQWGAMDVTVNSMSIPKPEENGILGAPSDYTVKDFGGDPPGVSSIVSGDRGLTFKKSGTSNSSMLAMKKDAAAMTGFEMAFQMDRFVSYRSSWSAPMSYYQVAFVDSAAEDGAGQNGVAFQFTPYEGTVLSAAGNRLRIEAFKVTNGAVDAGSRLDGSNPAHVAMEIENPYAAGSVNNPQIKFAIKQEGGSLVVYINDTAYSQYDLSSAGALASSCYLRMDLNCAQWGAMDVTVNSLDVVSATGEVEEKQEKDLLAANWYHETWVPNGGNVKADKYTYGYRVMLPEETPSGYTCLKTPQIKIDTLSVDFSFPEFRGFHEDYARGARFAIQDKNSGWLQNKGLLFNFMPHTSGGTTGILIRYFTINNTGSGEPDTHVGDTFIPMELNKDTLLNFGLAKRGGEWKLLFMGAEVFTLDGFQDVYNASFADGFAYLHTYVFDNTAKPLGMAIKSINGFFAGAQENPAEEDVEPGESEGDEDTWDKSGGSKGGTQSTLAKTDGGWAAFAPDGGNNFVVRYNGLASVEGFHIGFKMSDFVDFMSNDVWTTGVGHDHLYSIKLLNSRDLTAPTTYGIEIVLRPWTQNGQNGVRLEAFQYTAGVMGSRLDGGAPPFIPYNLNKEQFQAKAFDIELKIVNGRWRLYFDGEFNSAINLTPFNQIYRRYYDGMGYVHISTNQTKNDKMGFVVTRINTRNFTNQPIEGTGSWQLIGTGDSGGGNAGLNRLGDTFTMNVPQGSNGAVYRYSEAVPVTGAGFKYKYNFEKFPGAFSDWADENYVMMVLGSRNTQAASTAGVAIQLKPYTQDGAQGLRIEAYKYTAGGMGERIDGGQPPFIPMNFEDDTIYPEILGQDGAFKLLVNGVTLSGIDLSCLNAQSAAFAGGKGYLYLQSYSAKKAEMEWTVLKAGVESSFKANPGDEWGLAPSNYEATDNGMLIKTASGSGDVQGVYNKKVDLKGLELYFRLQSPSNYFKADWSNEIVYSIMLESESGRSVGFQIRPMLEDGVEKLYVRAFYDGDFVNSPIGETYVETSISLNTPLKLSINDKAGLWRIYFNDMPMPTLNLLGFASNFYPHFEDGKCTVVISARSSDASAMGFMVSKLNGAAFCSAGAIIEPEMIVQADSEPDPVPGPDITPDPEPGPTPDSTSNPAQDTESSSGSDTPSQQETGVPDWAPQGDSISDKYQKGDPRVIHKGSATFSYNRIGEDGYTVNLGHKFSLLLHREMLKGVKDNDILKFTKQELYPDTFASVNKDTNRVLLRGFSIIASVNGKRCLLFDEPVTMSYEVPDDLAGIIGDLSELEVYYISDSKLMKTECAVTGKTVTFKGVRFANEYVIATAKTNVTNAVPLSVNPTAAKGQPNNLWLILGLSGGGLIVVAGAAVALVIIERKRKRNKTGKA